MKTVILHVLFDAIVFAGLGISFMAADQKDKKLACIGIAVAVTGTTLRSGMDMALTGQIATAVIYLIVLLAISWFYRKF